MSKLKEKGQRDNKDAVLPSRPLNCSTRRDDGEDICCPFCSSIDAVIFADNEILCGNPDCEAYPKIKRIADLETENAQLREAAEHFLMCRVCAEGGRIFCSKGKKYDLFLAMFDHEKAV